jgi:hypothetical protein
MRAIVSVLEPSARDQRRGPAEPDEVSRSKQVWKKSVTSCGWWVDLKFESADLVVWRHPERSRFSGGTISTRTGRWEITRFGGKSAGLRNDAEL